MKLFSKITLCLLLFSVLTCSAQSQQDDTLSASIGKIRKYSLEPVKATMYAAALPGLGQIYNHKYWKVPIVYAGFGALAYAIIFNTKYYNTMTTAYQDFTDLIPETDSYLDLLTSLNPENYDPVLYPSSYNASTATWVETTLLNAVNYYRNYRDLSYIGMVAWYLVTIIDAHVDASLFDYDIDDNLKAAITPATFTYAGITPGVTLTLTLTF